MTVDQSARESFSVGQNLPTPPARAPWWRRGSLWRDVVVAILAFAAVNAWQGQSLVPVGTKLRLPGDEVTPGASDVTTAAAQSKVKIVYFFAPWCGVCKIASENVSIVARWLGTDRVVVIPTALDYENAADVHAYEAEHPFPRRAVLGDDSVRAEYRVKAYPTYYVLDRSNVVRGGNVGYSTTVGILWRTVLALL